MSHRPVWRGSLQAADESGRRYFSSAAELLLLLTQSLQEQKRAAGEAAPDRQPAPVEDEDHNDGGL